MKMRRSKQQLCKEECIEILDRNTSGVLALCDDFPYAVPMSYVYNENHIIFHCANEGHKLDVIAKNEKASFCVIDQDEVYPSKFTTLYRSVIVFGNIKIIYDPTKKVEMLRLLASKYSKDFKDLWDKEIKNGLDYVTILDFEIEEISGKEAKELMMNKNKA